MSGSEGRRDKTNRKRGIYRDDRSPEQRAINDVAQDTANGMLFKCADCGQWIDGGPYYFKVELINDTWRVTHKDCAS